MKYVIDEKRFRECLVAGDYRNLNDFAEKSGLHRNTLQGLLGGRSVLVSSVQVIANEFGIDPLELIVPVVRLPGKVKDVDELAPIVGRLVRSDTDLAVILIGSRAHGKAKQYADWDLGLVRRPQPVTAKAFLRWKGLVEEWSEDLVRLVDLINLDAAPKWFLENIDRPMLLGGNEETYSYFEGVLYGIHAE